MFFFQYSYNHQILLAFQKRKVKHPANRLQQTRDHDGIKKKKDDDGRGEEGLFGCLEGGRERAGAHMLGIPMEGETNLMRNVLCLFVCLRMCVWVCVLETVPGSINQTTL